MATVKEVLFTLNETLTADSKVRVWHVIAGAALLAFIMGALAF
jgi:hypothetical protein